MSTQTKEKKSNVVHFSVDGEGLTELVRDTWVSDLPKKAFNILMEGLIGMPKELALEIISGKKKLIGNSNTDEGITAEKDNVTEVCGIGLSVEIMEERLLRFYIETMESINIFNEVDLADFPFEERDDIRESTKNNLTYYKEKLTGIIEQLEFIFSLTGKTLKDLPILQVRSAKQIKDEERVKQEEARIIQEAKEKEQNRDKVFELNNGQKYYIVHTPVEKCKEEYLPSGWLLPDGTFFGGCGAWIHRGILESLDEYGFFKDKVYSNDEDDVQEKGGWIKVSGGDWMIWEHKHKPTKEQIEFIIDFTIGVNETDLVTIGSRDIHIQVFAKLLDGVEFDTFKMGTESKELIAELELQKASEKNDKEEKKFPSIIEISKIDPLCTPFFMPDEKFVKWLVKYAKGRLIVDIGCGSGYLCALIMKHGGKSLGVEPYFSMERKKFWMKHGYMFNVFSEQAEKSMVMDYPVDKMLFVFARPCHNGFVSRVIHKLKEGAEILYISHTQENVINDLGEIKYTELKHEGTSKSNEFVLSIKK